MHRWIGCTAVAWQRKSPKVTVDPPQSKMTPGSLTMLDREKGSQVYRRIPWGGHDRGQMAVSHPGLKGTWKGRGAGCMEPGRAVCSSSTTDRTTAVEGRGENQPLGVYKLFFHKYLIIATGGKVPAMKSPKPFRLFGQKWGSPSRKNCIRAPGHLRKGGRWSLHTLSEAQKPPRFYEWWHHW